jgi:hypothetical protein
MSLRKKSERLVGTTVVDRNVRCSDEFQHTRIIPAHHLTAF